MNTSYIWDATNSKIFPAYTVYSDLATDFAQFYPNQQLANLPAPPDGASVLNDDSTRDTHRWVPADPSWEEQTLTADDDSEYQSNVALGEWVAVPQQELDAAELEHWICAVGVLRRRILEITDNYGLSDRGTMPPDVATYRQAMRDLSDEWTVNGTEDLALAKAVAAREDLLALPATLQANRGFMEDYAKVKAEFAPKDKDGNRPTVPEDD